MGETDSWKNDSNVYSVRDEKGREMWYRLDTAENEPENAPTMLVLHGVGYVSRPSYYAEKNWNTIKPIDQYGYMNKGSWWLGENNDFFTAKLLEMVVNESKKKIGSSDNSKLFIYGSSMGGYGAILHGVKLNATAIYANVPQIRLLGSTYSNNGMKPHFEAIFGHDTISEYNDLTEFISLAENHPLYFICENRYSSTKNYLEEHALKLVNWFIENSINFHLEIIPNKGHNKNRGIREVRSLFEQYCLDEK